MLLVADSLVKSYNSRVVVNQVRFDVDDGEIVGLLGANGAGKTTSFRITVGMIRPDSGRVSFLGQDISRLPMFERARLGIGYLPQEASVFQRLTVEQNLSAVAETLKVGRAERKKRVEQLVEQFGLGKIRRSLAKPGLISGGERRRLEIARALITDPRLILLDEPFSGLDPVAVEELRHEIERLRDNGIAILLTDHNVHETLKVTDRSYVMHEGQVICSGEPREIINNDRVRATYLGSTFRGDEFDS